MNFISKIQFYLYALVATALFSGLVACKKTTKAKVISENASQYVYGYTTGTVSVANPIRVRFADALVSQEQVGQQAGSSLIRIRPSVSGTVRWEDDRTLLFEPDQWLDGGTSYLATVFLSELFPNAPADARSFEFDFQTKAQNMEVYVDGLATENSEDLTKQILKGTVFTADVAKADAIEQVLEAKQDGKPLPLEWSHSGNQMNHEFVVKSINRAKQAGQVDLTWNGRKLGVKEKNTKVVEIPSLDNFKVMDARVVQGGEQYIMLQFSDPLLASQDFKGLVSIDNYSGAMRFTVDGNQLRVYPASRISGEHRIKVQTGIKNSLKVKMRNPTQWDLAFEDIKPQLRLVGNGVILPQSSGLIFPFEAVNLQAVDVEIFKIYHNNILQFLQTNQITEGGDNYNLERVGRVILQKKVVLSNLNPQARSASWTRYALDLGQMIEQDPEAIYQVRLGFRKEYSSYACNSAPLAVLTSNEPAFDPNGEIESIWGDNYYGRGGYYEGFSWEHRENPCFPAYYNVDQYIRRNVVASNLGITVKSGKDGSVFAAVAEINSANPIPGVLLEFYDFQQQLIGSITTDGEGTAITELNRPAFVVTAKKNDQKGYLQMTDPTALSLSRFDVGGTQVQKGIKGFIYGERGVWRPGDSLFLNFILEDKLGKLPEKHPVSFELFDARDQLKEEITTDKQVNNMYAFTIATKPDDPTGNWRAIVKVGGAKFYKTLKVETVKPNRLKVQLDFGGERLKQTDGEISGDLQVNWLHGAPARNLKAKIEAKVKNTSTSFPKFKSFVFRDPARSFYAEPVTIFDNSIDAQGAANFSGSLIENPERLPGKMRVSFRTRAFENGGDFSEDNYTIDFDPFDAYAGVEIPQNKYRQKRLSIGKENNVEVALVDTDGNPLAGRELNVGLYRVNWRWWWDRDNSEVSRYNSSTHMNALAKGSVQTNSKGTAKWTTQVENWGRYMIRVCDPVSGHCSGDFFYAGYPWYDEDGDNSESRAGASMLVFMADKEKYEVGDQVELTIPTSGTGRVLVSIESGSKVLETYWRDADQGETKFKFYATEEMTPTVYANVSFIQPHGQLENDLPIRMYGVIPISVENPKTRLAPKIKMADVLQPEEKVRIEVSENKGRPMAYTVALVDDGLLDLTRFKTPDAWNSFYAREALGVKTWDVYDEVLGAYGGQLERLLSIGGDDVAGPGKENTTANRFKPVVKHFGPFYLGQGEKAAHEFVMPNYVGSVRTMVVAANNGAYGKAEKTCPVRKPLMVLATLPRVLGPGEQLTLPVNVFAMEDKVKNVTVQVEETSGLVQFNGGQSKSISFSQPGDQIVTFDLSVVERIGVARFKITASGNGEQASQEIEILIRNPNPFATDIVEANVEQGKEWETDFGKMGVLGTNSAVLEVSSIPPLNLGDRLRYLIQYPHGCIEQTTSSVFPQLYVDALMEVNDQQKTTMENNIRAGIDRLGNFQNNAGAFSYWPGEGDASYWGTNYAGHFLLEAKNKGYQVSPLMLERLIKFQQKIAKRWDVQTEDSYSSRNSTLMQAYRLYTLALAGKPELGAMNRLREMNALSNIAKWRLAGAYALAGKEEVAKQLIANLKTEVEDYVELSYTYGSGLRDQAMMLEVLTLLKEPSKGALVAREMAKRIGGGRWYGTQTVAYSLLAMGKFVGNGDPDKELKFAYRNGNGQWVDSGSDRPIMQINLPADGGKVALKNTANGMLFARLILRGQPLVGDNTAAENDLKIKVNYKTLKGKSLDPNRIEQGTDFIAEVTVTNPGTRGVYYREMALSQVFPSGWEILNTRMSDVQHFKNTSHATYQDIRDDRVYSYFDIGSKKIKTYRVQLNAAYQGRYYMPSVVCEAMYDYTINARQPGTWVEVVKPEIQ